MEPFLDEDLLRMFLDDPLIDKFNCIRWAKGYGLKLPDWCWAELKEHDEKVKQEGGGVMTELISDPIMRSICITSIIYKNLMTIEGMGQKEGLEIFNSIVRELRETGVI